MAKELGIELTEADFDQKSELNEDELETVAGGQSCYCAVSGGGIANNWKVEQCVCVLGGGEYSSLGGGGCRCACVGGGYGEDKWD